MGGRPWLRIAMVLLGFLLVGIPVWSITRDAPPADAVVAARMQDQKTLAFRIMLTFSEPPRSFVLSNAGQVISQGGGAGLEYHAEWKASVPPEGSDLLLKAEWPDGAPKAAVRVEITGQAAAIDQTFWSQGAMAETVTIPGNRAP